MCVLCCYTSSNGCNLRWWEIVLFIYTMYKKGLHTLNLNNGPMQADIWTLWDMVPKGHRSKKGLTALKLLYAHQDWGGKFLAKFAKCRNHMEKKECRMQWCKNTQQFTIIFWIMWFTVALKWQIYFLIIHKNWCIFHIRFTSCRFGISKNVGWTTKFLW